MIALLIGALYTEEILMKPLSVNFVWYYQWIMLAVQYSIVTRL